MLNKPQGVVSATEDKIHRTVLDLIMDYDAKFDIGEERQQKRNDLFPVLVPTPISTRNLSKRICFPILLPPPSWIKKRWELSEKSEVLSLEKDSDFKDWERLYSRPLDRERMMVRQDPLIFSVQTETLGKILFF